MAPPSLRLTKVEFKVETFTGELDPATGMQTSCQKLVAYTTYEAGAPDREAFHSVVRVRGIVGPNDGDAAAVDAAWANLHDLSSHWSDQTKAWTKVKPFREVK